MTQDIVTGKNGNVYQIQRGKRRVIHKMWKRPETLEKPLRKWHLFMIKISKKCLTRGERFGIIVKLACGGPRGGQANLENDTERNAQEIQRRFQRV